MQCNPGLFSLIREAIGDEFMDDAEALKSLEPFARDAEFRAKFAAVKRDNKARLSNLVARRMGIKLDPSALFDIQIKRIHEYKRQLLNIIEAVALYDQIRFAPRTRLDAPGEILRRQGGAELSQCQADHQSWPMTWRGSSTTILPCAAFSRSSSSPTTMSPWPR